MQPTLTTPGGIARLLGMDVNDLLNDTEKI